MNDLFLFAAHNTVAALVFALLVFGVTRLWRNPPMAHLLWLLVLLRLVAPPLVQVDVPALRLPGPLHVSERSVVDVSPVEHQAVERDPPRAGLEETDGSLDASHASLADHSAAGAIAPASKEIARENKARAAGRWMDWNRARLVLLWVWIVGAVLCAVVAVMRIVRFERLLRGTLPASDRLQQLASEIAAKLGVRRAPDVRYVDCVEVPLLWCAGKRATIVLPMRLLREFDDQQAAMILAHELAHLRRRDHWARAVELIVATVYWWNPLAWAVRRQIHQAEELCCDAWVRWLFPDCTKRYAEVVLKAAESVSAASVGARLLPASLFLHSLSLKARVEMILGSRFAPRISTRSMFVVALLAALILPSFVLATRADAQSASTGAAPATPAGKPEPAPSSEFPYVVKFEQGATKFLDGDNITILEVRGTADTFKPGDIFWIKGTYTLASHDAAMLAAYTTAMEAKDGTSTPYSVQSIDVKKGSGTFTVFLPMACKGWPHVSFYAGGTSIGGNYFGTGDSVLKRWWGEKEAEAARDESKAAKQLEASRRLWRAFGRVMDVDGRPLPGVEIWAHCGNGTLKRTGVATSGEDGRYELDFGPGIFALQDSGSGVFSVGKSATVQFATISAHKTGYSEENLNRQGGCWAAGAMPDEEERKLWGDRAGRLFLPDRPLELDFVMRPAARVAGRLVDEQGRPLAKYSVSLTGADLPPSSSILCSARTDDQGRFALENIPTTFRFQFGVRKADPKPPWDDSWASAALRFDHPEQGDLRAWFGNREIRLQQFVLCVAGSGVHGKTATPTAGNAGLLDLTIDAPSDVLESSDARLAARSATLTLRNSPRPELSESLITESNPAASAVESKTRLARTQSSESGDFVISFENPRGFDLAPDEHQVIFQVFVGASRTPIREKILRQLEVRSGRYEVPVEISPQWIDDSRVSITFVTIQPKHDAWVRAFFHEGKGTSYRGMWTSDSAMVPAIPLATSRRD